MLQLAAIVGRFIGAVLAECAPVLVEILSHAIREAFTDTVEDGARDDDLRKRLLERVQGDAHGVSSTGGTSTTSGAGEGEDLGEGPGREAGGG